VAGDGGEVGCLVCWLSIVQVGISYAVTNRLVRNFEGILANEGCATSRIRCSPGEGATEENRADNRN
jgi:hypothetical protein